MERRDGYLGGVWRYGKVRYDGHGEDVRGCGKV